MCLKLRSASAIVSRFAVLAVALVGPIVSAGPAAAQPPAVVLIPADAEMAAVVSAVRAVRAEGPLPVSLRVVSYSQQSADDLAAIERARMVVLFNIGQELPAKLAPQIAAQKKNGGTAFVVGQLYTDEERKAGFVRDESLAAYGNAGGAENWSNLLRTVIARVSGRRRQVPPAVEYPKMALWEPRSGRTFDSWEPFEARYIAEHPASAGRRWVGILANREQVTAGVSPVLRDLVSAFEARGLNVAAAYGYPPDAAVEHFFIGAPGQRRIEALVGIAIKFGNVPDRTVPIVQRLDVPIVNAITLYGKSRAEWEASLLGLDLTERAWQVAVPEFAGAVQPTVIASRERRHDEMSGVDYLEETPIPGRVDVLADRVRNWVTLRTTPARNKRVAIIYYNYPPGRENVGASYLNVMPQSLWQMLMRLEQDGYTTTGRPRDAASFLAEATDHGVNVNAETPGALERLVRTGQCVLLPVADYRRWIRTMPAALIEPMTKAWGEPEDSKLMVWRDGKGLPYFVFPALRYGNIVFTPQPTRGWEQDIKKAYHDLTIPPHHQYLAFYLWLQRGFRANAMVHVGTHGTMEWLSGKEIGQSAADPSEAVAGNIPHLYAYIVDVIGEGLQAKRRGMATLLSHMTPPFDKAGLNPQLMTLRALLDDYTVAAQKSETATAAVLADINANAAKQGVLKDLGMADIRTAQDVEVVEHYLKEIGEKQVPFGMHTFGVAPGEAERRATAEAVIGIQGTGEETHGDAVVDFMRLMEDSARAELDAFSAGLAGRYVAAGPGGDPMRRPDSLPTGRDLYGFDPSRLPTTGTWAQGQALAAQFVTEFRKKHGTRPERIVFNLWSNETMRHEGIVEAEILALLGVKPVWDPRGKVQGIEVVPREALGRPRVDVTVVPSGLYRDALPVLMQLIDSAVTAVKDLDEGDNAVRAHVLQTRKALEERGVKADEAARMAAVRVFTEPSGVYGTGVPNVAMASNTWKSDSEVADVFFQHEGHLFGQGFWGEQPGGTSLAVDIFKMSLKGAQAVIHSRATNVYATLDNDDMFQYLGGTSMAVRSVNGSTPETMVLDLATPGAGKHETLEQFMGKEMRTRYLNPEWIDRIMKEGYAGARMVMQVTDNLWGWQVTVPDAVGDTRWQEMYETYVKDRNNLDIRNRFRQAGNLRAYQGVVDRMLVAVNKGYWKADASVVADLHRVNDEVMREAGVACDSNSCSDDDVAAFAKLMDQRTALVAGRMRAPNVAAMVSRGRPAPPSIAARGQGAPSGSAAAATARRPEPARPQAQPPIVRGRKMTDVTRTVVDATSALHWPVFAVLAVLVLAGFSVGQRVGRWF